MSRMAQGYISVTQGAAIFFTIFIYDDYLCNTQHLLYSYKNKNLYFTISIFSHSGQLYYKNKNR